MEFQGNCTYAESAGGHLCGELEEEDVASGEILVVGTRWRVIGRRFSEEGEVC